MHNILKISLAVVAKEAMILGAATAVILEDAGVAAAAAVAAEAAAVAAAEVAVAAVAAEAAVAAVAAEVVKGTGNFPCSDFKKDIFVIY